jgi:hypothetical protein
MTLVEICSWFPTPTKVVSAQPFRFHLVLPRK